MDNLPYKEDWISENKSIREFRSDLDDEELKWHFDEEDRIVVPINKSDWKFQYDNQLPIEINEKIYIKKGEWHRLIKGTGDLRVLIIRSQI
jgi:hypothetical protein